MTKFLYQYPEWPTFHWDQERIATRLGTVRHRQGRLLGRMERLGFSLKAEATLQALTAEVVKSSEIEGDILDPQQVRSSIAKRLGLKVAGVMPTDRHVEGVVEMMMDATQRYQAPLTEDRLFGWQAALFPAGRSGMVKIIVGRWRDDHTGPMQVVSGPLGHERVHYEAPRAESVPQDMRKFLEWFNGAGRLDDVLKAGLAHLWFVTIHPFEDGNGRIARAIADMALARSENSPQRFYSMSFQIRIERAAYYDALENAHRVGLDVTGWLEWFLNCLDRAIVGAETVLGDVLKKTRFWEGRGSESFNARQRVLLNRMLEGFEGKLTSTKWAKLAKCSQDTASRDIQDLIDRGILIKDAGGGRSTSFSLSDR